MIAAHRPEDPADSRRHPLIWHLLRVAGLAGRFAAPLASREWGRLAGLWHDLGKYRQVFQRYLEGDWDGTDKQHAAVGALLAGRATRGLNPIELIIACHHTGLHNACTVASRLRGEGTPVHLLDEALNEAPAALTRRAMPLPPSFLAPRPGEGADREIRLLRFELWQRLLFSALVDADFLDTERFMKGLGTRPRFPSIGTLCERLDAAITAKVTALSVAEQMRPVNRQRQVVLAACLQAATQPAGVFSLCVPTGGGKTLSGMAFALHHARHHGLRRVIVAIPYTSIIEQNAKVYREALGADSVVEHHSALDPAKETRRNKLASENWDAPVIVTTNVQLFESLFANRTSACRKLHRVAQSVIVLDEAQAVPPGFLNPLLDVLTQLVEHYGCTLMLSTATQPALGFRDNLRRGFRTIREIIPDTVHLARRLTRVTVRWPALDAGATPYRELADQILAEKEGRVLAIVHRRQDARELAQLLPADCRFHLSAQMCPAHRQARLATLRERLADPSRRPCFAVTTQLVEAGVDIDFPVVYRALAGLDSLAQAAGRCNREGERDRGEMIIFQAPTMPPRGVLARGYAMTMALRGLRAAMPELLDANGELDLGHPALFALYFRKFYAVSNLDDHGIDALRQELRYEDVAQQFRLIPDGATQSVVVPYGQAMEQIHAVRQQGANSDRLRALQPFLVQLYSQDWAWLQEHGAVETLPDTGIHVLTPQYGDLYAEEYGLVLPVGEPTDPGRLVV